ncbi:hypothetical protein L596_018125 [Steinernema carpocapsae]|uniref:Uncharacterized protein n=1 Tax=Steinernema carpocapsae TaxID=34508 RepID=A0A4U5N3R0_STECR|nr:hypothetical protein L596_018125 [Steinernema carpocapsae]
MGAGQEEAERLKIAYAQLGHFFQWKTYRIAAGGSEVGSLRAIRGCLKHYSVKNNRRKTTGVYGEKPCIAPDLLFPSDQTRLGCGVILERPASCAGLVNEGVFGKTNFVNGRPGF